MSLFIPSERKNIARKPRRRELVPVPSWNMDQKRFEIARNTAGYLANRGSLLHNRVMEEAILLTGIFAAGAGAGAFLSYARDRNLLQLYGHLVHDLSRMIPRDDPGSPEPPAVAARVVGPSSTKTDVKCAS
jgi:hypothetical protein